MTATVATKRPVTASASVSWYLRPTDPLLGRAAELVDAVTVAGPFGPAKIRGRRNAGFDVPVLFDGEGYAGKPVAAPNEWASMQRAVDADRVLLPGVFAAWEKDELRGVHHLNGLLGEQSVVARDLDAVILLAIDSRWVAYRTTSVLEVLRETGVPVALVLASRALCPGTGPSANKPNGVFASSSLGYEGCNFAELWWSGHNPTP